MRPSGIIALFSFAIVFSGATPPIAPTTTSTVHLDQPASHYLLGPEDQILIRGVDIEEIANAPLRIDDDGSVTLAMVGKIQAAGYTLAEFRSLLIKSLAQYVRDPQVTVSLLEIRSHPVAVMGAVNTPGVQQIQGTKTIMEVLSSAGGLRPDARYTITITRRRDRAPLALPHVTEAQSGEYRVGTINIRSIMDGTAPETNIAVAPDDLISVPRSELVFVVGAVHKSGGFVVGDREALSALQCLALAEGLERTAAPKQAKLLRTDPKTSVRSERPINLSAVITGTANDPALEPGDILFVPSSKSKSVGMRSLEMAIGMASGIGTGLVIYR